MSSSTLPLMPPSPNPACTANQSPLTLEQLLKSPLAPPPSKEFSANGNPDDDEQPTPHTSSKNNRHYAHIDDLSLTMFTRKKVKTFRDSIAALSAFVTFRNDMKQPFTASTISNEGDVTAYLESQVIIPTWDAVTRMFPLSGRTYDLMTKRQFYMKVCDLRSCLPRVVLTSPSRESPTLYLVARLRLRMEAAVTCILREPSWN